MADLRPTNVDEARTTYGRAALVSLWVLLAMFTAIGWAAYLQEGSLVWLTIGVVTPIALGTALFRLHRGELAVDAHGTLRMAAMQRRQVDLGSLRSVQLSAGLPYRDMSTYALAHQHGLVVTDASGTEIAFSTQKGGQWRDPGPIVARVIAAVTFSVARCTPRCWELMHAVAELDEPPYPQWLTGPPPDAWGTPIRTSRRTRTGVAIAQWALVSFPLAASVTLALVLGSAYPVQAGLVLLGGMAVSGPAAAWLLTVRRRADASHTRVFEDGRVEQREHIGGRFQLRLQVVEGSADLRQLKRARFEPATKLEPKVDLPVWWRLRMEDAAGGQLRFELLHEHEPPALLIPQLRWFIEKSGLMLDPVTHRGLSLRFGRQLSNPAEPSLL